MILPFGGQVLAVGLAAVGALCFGLAAVRQHHAVRSTFVDGLDEAPGRASESTGATSTTGRLASALRLVRQPAWLLGAGQAGLGGALHMVALTLAPVTLVQPVGVLAVPVTLVRSALLQRRRPSCIQLVGTSLSVIGVAALTVVLIRPTGHPAVLPTWSKVVGHTIVVALGAGVFALLPRAAPGRLACAGRAVAAAVLFGLASVLVRIVGLIVTTVPGQQAALLTAALLGLALALPLGVWSMQSAYLFCAPQVVICCLTLVDPVAAVVSGRVLLGDGASVSGRVLLMAGAWALVAATGVVLLARGYRADEGREALAVSRLAHP